MDSKFKTYERERDEKITENQDMCSKVTLAKIMSDWANDRAAKVIAEKDAEIEKDIYYLVEFSKQIDQMKEKLASRDAMIDKLEEGLKKLGRHQHNGFRHCCCDILGKIKAELAEWRKQNG